MGVTRFPNGISDRGVARRAGRQSVTGTATIATGLVTVTSCIASLETVGTSAGDPFIVTAKPSATAGSIDVAVKQDDGTAASVAGFVGWTAAGTA